jgi:hypothetical protein
MNTTPSKHAAASKTNQLGMVVIILACFNMFQDYSASGIQGIQEADMLTFLTGLGVIINRIKDKHGRKLHLVKERFDKLS